MRQDSRTIIVTGLLVGCALLTACGSGDKGGNAVQMKDMEVVDGTATDAMTDLDGVQSEGTAIAGPVGNTGNAAGPAPAPADKKAAASDDEVLADQ
jgi:hypothetical protein